MSSKHSLLDISCLQNKASLNTKKEWSSKQSKKYQNNTKMRPINWLESKTKCIVFSKKKHFPDPASITLDGKNLPWAKKISHLGCTLETDYSMKADLAQKRCQFIGKTNSLLQEFHFIGKESLLKLIDTYATSFYRSSLWNLLSSETRFRLLISLY